MATPKKKKAPAKKAAPRKRAPQTRKQIGTRMAIDAAVKRNEAKAREVSGADLEVTEASAWVGKAPTEGTKLALPSGNVCLAVNKGLMPFIEQGVIPNELMPLITEAVSTGKGMSNKQLKEVMATPEALASIMGLTDAIVVDSVLKPVVLPVPLWTEADAEAGDCPQEMVGKKSNAKKDPANLYIDQVDLNDKMFIFQWVVGGTRDLERFREESSAALEDLGAEQDVEGPSE